MRLLAVLLFINLLCVSVYAEDEPAVNAVSAVLMDAETGRVLWEKDCDKPMAMASTTKIMTCIIALENGKLDDEVVVGKNATLAPPVKMYLTENEKIRLEDLLYALMLQSSNDAAVAVAEHIGGSVENFCDMMNTKAEELGCIDTVFETPNGLDKGNHHSTAREMAMITRYALKNEDFVRIINTKNADFSTNKKHYSFVNKDRLLSEYEGAMGVKTGFTGKAGHCFVGAAKRGDIQLISVVLASGWGSVGKSRKWSDTKAILDYGFDNFEKTTVLKRGDRLSAVCVDRARVSVSYLAAADDVSMLVKKGEKVDYELKTDKPYIVSAPIKKGDVIGKSEVYVNGCKIGETKLVATDDIERFCFEDNLKNIFKKWFLVE